MTTQTTYAAFAKSLEGALPALTDEDRRLARAMVRLMSEGQAVPVERLAAALDRPVEATTAALSRLPWVYRDDRDRVIGFWGLSVAETPHRLLLGERRVYAWCAQDALFLAMVLDILLDREVRIESRCPTTGEPVRLAVTPSEIRDLNPGDAVMSFVRPDAEAWTDPRGVDVITTFCHFIHFFASESAAKAWIAQHPDTARLAIEDAVAMARLWAERMWFGLPSGISGDAAPIVGIDPIGSIERSEGQRREHPPAKSCCLPSSAAACDRRTGQAARIAFAAIRHGQALGVEDIARRAGTTPEATAAELRVLAEAGEANLDDEGRVVAVAGLSVVPAAHVLVLDGVKLHTWCAWDAIGIPAALGADARVRTRCGSCGRRIEVELSGGRVVGDDSTVLWYPGAPLGGAEGGNPQLAWCPQANLFCDRDHLQEWRRAHGEPAGDAVGMPEGTRRGAAHWAPFRDPAT